MDNKEFPYYLTPQPQKGKYMQEIRERNPRRFKCIQQEMSPTPEQDFDEDTHYEPIMIFAGIGAFTIKRILVDMDCSHDVIFVHALSKMDISWSRLPFHTARIVSFAGKEHPVIENILLPLVLGESSKLVAIKILNDRPPCPL